MFSSKCKKKILGFTFLEIMVAVAIVAILASLSIIATTRVRLKSRDIKRISNATEIVSALEAYYAANNSYPTMIFPGQAIESNGREFLRAVPSNPYPRTDGGCADSDYTYTTTSTGYRLTFCIGTENARFAEGIVVCKNGNCGIREDCSGEVEDEEGIRYPMIRIGEQCWMAMHLKSKRNPNGTCVNVSMGGYNVDANCLTQANVNGIQYNNAGGFGGCPAMCAEIGSRRDCIKLNPPIFGPGTLDYSWTDRGVDKPSSQYEYPPTSDDSTCNLRGALYTWAGAMNLDNISPPPDCDNESCSHLIQTPHRGICPQNWHIPTDEEFSILERYLTLDSFPCDADRNSYDLGSCPNAGSRLIQGGDSGFNALLLGIRELPGGDGFDKINEEVRFWTTAEPSSYEAVARTLKVGDSSVYRHFVSKDTATAVRCIRDY